MLQSKAQSLHNIIDSINIVIYIIKYQHMIWSNAVIHLHDRIVQVLEEFMLETGATKERDLRLEVRRIRQGASQDQPRMSFG
jgi:hypothetical protein